MPLDPAPCIPVVCSVDDEAIARAGAHLVVDRRRRIRSTLDGG